MDCVAGISRAGHDIADVEAGKYRPSAGWTPRRPSGVDRAKQNRRVAMPGRVESRQADFRGHAVGLKRQVTL